MFTYFPLPMTRFDEMALIRHLLSQQEAIRLELFCLRLTQRSGSILPKVAWSFDENLLEKIFLENLLLSMAQSKGDKEVLHNQENLDEQHGRLMEK